MKLPFAQRLKEMTEPVNVQIDTMPKFELLSEADGSLLMVDSKLKIIRLEWLGVVKKETATQLLKEGADAVEFGEYKRLIVNRSNLIEFDTEARIWIKKFLQMRAKRIASKVKKLAIINPTSVRGSIFSNMISSAINLIMPTLQMEKFPSESDASQWLIRK